MEKVTLQVHGREKSFSKEELTAILEKHFLEVAPKPTVGKCFEVFPENIDKTLFTEERKDALQETTRILISEAFSEMEKDPKYLRPFKTMIPKRWWERGMRADQLDEMASHIGDHTADWVEQALEWAQRIQNGEEWEQVCNSNDELIRIIIWKNGRARIVGNPKNSSIYEEDLGWFTNFTVAVPVVVVYE